MCILRFVGCFFLLLVLKVLGIELICKICGFSYFWLTKLGDMGKWEILRILKLITVIFFFFLSVICIMFCICLFFFEEYIYFILRSLIILKLFRKVSVVGKEKGRKKSVSRVRFWNQKLSERTESVHLFIYIILFRT